MDKQMHFEEIVNYILSHRSDLSFEKVIKAIDKKKVDSEGFLTDEAAARLVATELGLKVECGHSLPEAHINQLVSGLSDVTVSGRVLLVSRPHTFSGPRGTGQIARLLIADKTGSIKVVLWNDKAELVKKIDTGQVIKVVHGYARRSRNGEIELHVGERGNIQSPPSGLKESNFPLAKDLVENIVDITDTSRKVNVKGVVQKMHPMSTFQRRDGSQGKVLRAVLKDETGWIPVVFWNDKAEDMSKAQEGMTVLVINARMRNNSRDNSRELHVGHFAHIEISS